MRFIKSVEGARKALLSRVAIEHKLDLSLKCNMNDFRQFADAVSGHSQAFRFDQQSCDFENKRLVFKPLGLEKIALFAPLSICLTALEIKNRNVLLKYNLVTTVVVAMQILMSVVFYSVFFIIYIYVQDYFANDPTQIKFPFYYGVVAWIVTLFAMSVATRFVLYWAELFLAPVRRRFEALIKASL